MLLASTPWKLLRDDVNSAQLFPSLSSSFATTAPTSSIAFPLSAIAVYWLPFTCFESHLNLAGQQLP